MKNALRLILIAGALVAAIAAQAASLTLTWKDNSNNEEGFAIERSIGTGTPVWAEIARVGKDVIEFKDEGLPNSTAFSYRVRAFNPGGYSGYAGPVTGTTVVAPPADPSDMKVLTVTVVVTVTPSP
jgi:hypothetical protein